MAKTTPATVYVVMHNMVGPHIRGEVISFTDEQIARGTDPNRLLSLGAIREATADDGDAVPYGQAREDIPVPFPSVPFEAKS